MPSTEGSSFHPGYKKEPKSEGYVSYSQEKVGIYCTFLILIEIKSNKEN